MLLVRALLSWVVISFVVTLLVSLFGLIGVYEYVFILAVSAVLTVFVLRRWARREADRLPGASSS